MSNENKVVLEVKNLTKTYGKLKAVSNLNLKVLKGEIFGFLGPNGAGKTTTLECILGTKKYDEGKVMLLGQDPAQERKELFEHVGVQFQTTKYPERIKVWEMCQLQHSLYKNAVSWESLLMEFNLKDKANEYVSELSGGQQQKLSILLTLINEPSIVFLDELTTGLDPKARRNVWKYIKELKEKGLTVFLTSHYMDEVMFLCDRISIIAKGEEVILGMPDEIMAQSKKDNLEEAYLFYTNEEESI